MTSWCTRQATSQLLALESTARTIPDKILRVNFHQGLILKVMLHSDILAKEELRSKPRLAKPRSNGPGNDGYLLEDFVDVVVVGEFGGALGGVKVLGVEGSLRERSAGRRNVTTSSVSKSVHEHIRFQDHAGIHGLVVGIKLESMVVGVLPSLLLIPPCLEEIIRAQTSKPVVAGNEGTERQLSWKNPRSKSLIAADVIIKDRDIGLDGGTGAVAVWVLGNNRILG